MTLTLTERLDAHRLDADLTFRQLRDAIAAETRHDVSISNLHKLCHGKPADAEIHDRTAHHIRKYLDAVDRRARRAQKTRAARRSRTTAEATCAR